MSAAASWGLIGHDEAVARLIQTIAADKVGHAYLITGPQGVGRTTLALAFAKALTCLESTNGIPCGACQSCRRVARDAEHRTHPDITVADVQWQATVLGSRASDATRQRLSIDAIRWLRQDIATRPILSRWKVQIVDDADRLSDAAPDAFLKTLEEPPASAVIMLVAESYDAVPETIRSRCQHIALGLVDRATIQAALLERGIAEREARAIAAISRGRPGAALDLARSPEVLEEWKQQVREAFEHIRDPLGRLRIAGPIAANHTRDRERTFRLLETCTGLWRDALLLKSGLTEAVSFADVAGELRAYVEPLSEAEILRALRATRRATEDLERNFQARIALLAMVEQWPQSSR